MVASDGDSLVPAYGGVISVSGGGKRDKGKRTTGLTEPTSKESYAVALRGQIQANSELRAVQRAAADGDVDSILYPYGEVLGAPTAGVAARRQSVGRREVYGTELREQIVAGQRKKVEQRAAEDNFERELLHAQVSSSVVETPRRLLRPVGPKPPTDAYAQDLERQMEEKSQRRVDAQANKTPRLGNDPLPGQDPRFVRERRASRQAAMPKEDYASVLRDQMADRQDRVQRDRSRRTPDEERTPFSFVAAAEPDHPRGMRTHIEHDSKESYGRALQEQMAQRAANRDASAHHRQMPTMRNFPPAVSRTQTEDSPRRMLALPRERTALSKQEYAAVLEEQIEDRARRVVVAAATTPRSPRQAAAGGVVPQGGLQKNFRPRPVEGFEPNAHQQVLREQMAARNAERAAQAFHAQQPKEVFGAGILPQAQSERSQGKRCIGARAAGGMAEHLHEDLRHQILQREGLKLEEKRREEMRLARQVQEAQQQIRERQGALERARPQPQAADALDRLMGGGGPGGGQW